MQSESESLSDHYMIIIIIDYNVIVIIINIAIFKYRS